MKDRSDFHAQDWISTPQAGGSPPLTDEQREFAKELLGLVQDIHPDPSFVASLEKRLADPSHLPGGQSSDSPERKSVLLAGMRSTWRLGLSLAALALIVILIVVSLEFLPRTAAVPSASQNTPTATLRETSILEMPATPIHQPDRSNRSPTVASTPPPELILASTRVLAGLVYRAFLGNASLYQINAAGQSVALSNHVNVNISALSPDGRWGLVNSLGDYWIIDLAQDNLLKLTLTPDRQESGGVWWPARPGLILFDSFAVTGERDLSAGMGYLSVIHSDGSGYQVLDEEHPAVSPPAPSPDGQWVAYGAGETAWLYRWEQGPQVFDPRDYGLESLKGQRISEPQWSPDGKKLAWRWESVLNVGPRLGLVVFDLERKNALLLHLFEPATESSGLEFRWSPDGKWLAVLAQSKEESQAGTWVVSADGQMDQEWHLTGMDYAPAVWSPDGRWLALMPLGAKNQSENGLWLIDSASWQRSFVALSQGGPYDVLEWKQP